MSIWQWLAARFSAPAPVVKDAGFLLRDGVTGKVELKWRRESLPIDIYLHASAADYYPEVMSVVRGINTALGFHAFAFPTSDLTDTMIDAWSHEGKRALLKGCIMLRGDGTAVSNQGIVLNNHIGNSDFRYDKRTGEINNVLATMPPRNNTIQAIGQQWTYQALLHEIGGHGLGLDHDGDPDSIMWPVLRDDATQLLGGDIGRLRKAYGP